MEDIGTVAVLAFVGWVLVELAKDLQVMQEEWKERVAKKKQERLKRDLKIIEGRISRGEE
jgi:hypothetical protein